MAIYVYNTTTGALVSYCPDDIDPVAPSATLAPKADILACAKERYSITSSARYDHPVGHGPSRIIVWHNR
jgi:hypothetical protein